MLCKMYRPQKELKDIITFLDFLANIYVAALCSKPAFRKGRLHPCLRRGRSHGGHSDAQRKTESKNGGGGGCWQCRGKVESEQHGQRWALKSTEKDTSIPQETLA